jgi:hypothetical protein
MSTIPDETSFSLHSDEEEKERLFSPLGQEERRREERNEFETTTTTRFSADELLLALTLHFLLLDFLSREKS